MADTGPTGSSGGSEGGTDGFSPQGLKVRALPPLRPPGGRLAALAVHPWFETPDRPLQPARKPAEPTSLLPPSAPPPQVLVVDDDPMCLKVVSAMLQRCNYEGEQRRRPPDRRRARCCGPYKAARCTQRRAQQPIVVGPAVAAG